MIEIKRNVNRYFIGIFFVLFCFLVAQSSEHIVRAEKRVIQYNGKKYTYTKKKVNVEVNGMEISTPFGGLILSNTALVPAYYTYKQSELETIYQYDKKNKMVILENVEHRVEFPLGQKYAYIDGKKKAIEHAAILVKDMNTKKSCVMVPGRVSADALGYQYRWENDRMTSCIFEKELEQENDMEELEETEEIPEQNDDIDGMDVDGEEKENDSFDGEKEETDIVEEIEQPTGEIPLEYKVKIPKPTKAISYSVDDNYWEKVYTLRFDKDYSDFFDKHKIEQKNSNITKTTIMEKNGCTEIKFYTSKIQAFRITETNEALYIEVGNPKDLYDKVVVLDPGHGGTDPGMTGNGVIEKNKTLEIAKAAKKYFDKNKEIKVYYTRLADTVPHVTAGSTGVKNSSMSLAPRYNLANTVEADLFISIHVNSWIDRNTNGTETLYSSSNNRTNEYGMSSKQLATMMHKEMLKVIGRADRGVKVRNNLAVLRSTKMPAILIETAFATNKKDAEVLKTKVDEIAKTIYDVTVKAFQ